MSLQEVGFFRELSRGRPDGPSLVDAFDDGMPSEVRAAVAHYLRVAPVLAATSERTRDVFDPDGPEVSNINVHTDGVFRWPEDLAYYVEKYGVRLPSELVNRALAGEPPSLSVEQLMEFAPPEARGS